MPLKTPKDVLAEFDKSGVSIAAWARERDLPVYAVRGILSGKFKGRRGIAHNAAVMLGVKDGALIQVGGFGKPKKK
jgi:gp16 family phage-associated protein